MPRKYAENEAEHIIRAIVNEAEGGAIHADDVLNAAAEKPESSAARFL